jgi:Uma2 family endonuclease
MTLMSPWRFDVVSYHVAVDAGVFGPEPRIELIEGEVYPMAAQNAPNAYAVSMLTRAAAAIDQGRFTVRVQLPVLLSVNSEPEPDLVLAETRGAEFSRRHPAPAEITLLVEIADTSIQHDHGIKLPRYAHAGIPEVWLVSIPGRSLTRFTWPDRQTSHYRTEVRYGDGEIITHEPTDLQVSVSELFPPP